MLDIVHSIYLLIFSPFINLVIHSLYSPITSTIPSLLLVLPLQISPPLSPPLGLREGEADPYVP